MDTWTETTVVATVDASIGQLLRLVQQAQSRVLDLTHSYDLTGPQYSVLSAVVSRPGIDQRAVSVVTHVDKSTVGAIVRRLVDKRLINASVNSEDRRRVHLQPTRAAIAILYDATPLLLAGNDEFLGPIAPSERQPFMALLQEVAFAGRAELPPRYVVPSPDGRRPALTVPWGLGRLLRACLQRYGQVWAARVPWLTQVQWLAVAAINGGHDIDQRRLKEMISLDKASLTVMLDRMIVRGWIVKERDPADARRRILRLTETGRELFVEVAPEIDRVDEEFLTPVYGEQRAALVSGLQCLLTGAAGAHVRDQRGTASAGD